MTNTTAVRAGISSHAETLADLIGRIDLTELVAETAGPGRQIANRYTYRCPNHGHHAHGDRTPSFTVTMDGGRQRWRCWGACSTGGDALDYVQWHHGLDRTEAIRYLRARAGGGYVEAPRRAAPAPTKRTPPPPRTPPIPTGEPSTDDLARELLAAYATWRGWPVEVAEGHGLHVVTVGTGVYVRHPFYVPTATGPVMFGWQDRARGRTPSPKWKAPPGWPLPLWGSCSLVAPELPAAVICEGPADGITATYALAEYAGVAVVAVPGTSAWRPEWSPLFEGLHVVTALDPDEAGDGLTEKIRTDLDGVAASVTPASRELLTTDLTDALRHHGPHYVAAALLEPLHLLKVIDQ